MPVNVNNPIYLKDFYKVGHFEQYPKGTSLVFSNFTPRKSRMTSAEREIVNGSVFFGIQYFMEHLLVDLFDNFFNHDLVLEEYQNFMQQKLWTSCEFEHIGKLKSLRYLPIAIHALPEGVFVPCGVPALVIYNTHPDFYWLPNMLETIMSCTLWGACTAATVASEYRNILDRYAAKTSDMPEFVDYQAHDFSFRGMFGLDAAILAGMAHLHYFKGTDNIPAIIASEKHYVKQGVCSVPATEHSVMCAGGQENELETFKRLITEIYPDGIVSIVSDTWDLWNVVDNYLPLLKDLIMKRNGKVVIRPDSGYPSDIICGAPANPYQLYGSFTTLKHIETRESQKRKGLIEKLWDIFGGTVNSKGYKQLDPHIGAIYGDSITPGIAEEICKRLKNKGFASTNIVFGVGSYSYQYHTRDTLGWAMKATYAEINGQPTTLFKNPKTDDGTKKSHKGLLKVVREQGIHKGLPWRPHGKDKYSVKEDVSWSEFHAEDNELKLIYRDGVIKTETCVLLKERYYEET